MMRKFTLLVAALGLVTLTVGAAPRTSAQMQTAAAKAINQHLSKRHMAPRNGALKVLKQAEGYQILGYEGGGYAVVATDDLVPELLGVSTTEYSGGRNKNLEGWLRAMNAVVSNAAARHTPLKAIAPDPGKYPTDVEPLVTTEWDQEEPYDRMCPIFNGSTHCLTGCVATAMAQVLNYHQLPEHGYGQRTIYYHSQAVSANFEESHYDWNNMLDRYVAGNYTDEQANAVALLMHDCGVAANMEYGGPNEGSGAYSSDAAEGMRLYFGFADAELKERDYYSDANWMDMVFYELSENGPLYYGGADYWQGGHAFVVHGYRADGKVYVNWGWSGQDDGYYDISMLNPASYEFNYGQDMIVGVKSDGRVGLRSEAVTLAEAGLLQQTVEALEGEGDIGTLTVSGPLSVEDLLYVRSLAGSDAEGAETEGKLRVLDLTNAILPNDGLPAGVFRNCQRLQRVRLPQSLTTIGREAFSGCTSLRELRVPTLSVPTLGGNGVFADVPVQLVRLYVRSGLKTKYSQAAQWKDFGKDNIIEFGTSVKVRNTIRKYGEENPEFFYTVSGDPITGTPELTCEATPTSPAGRYPIYISQGTVTTSDVNFIDGYLIVQKADAKAMVDNVTREEGQPNPDFTLSYEGLVNKETAPVWLQEPVFVCEANEQSPEGEYDITVASATAESYELTFVPGKLTVVSITTDIRDVKSGTRQQPVYTLDGRRVTGQPAKGIYLKGGKKHFVR